MNEQHPAVSYRLSSNLGGGPFPENHLYTLLPLSPSDFSRPKESCWTYLNYFQAIQEILARDSYTLLLEAVKRQLVLPAFPIEVQRVLIYSEKHGNWYHPAKIEAILPQGCARFVLNVALTERGRTVMAQEIRALKGLSQQFTYPFLPTVYFQTEAESPFSSEEKNHSLSLFLADWFEGFHEFHLSVDDSDGITKSVLWDSSPKPNYLTNLQARLIYQQISKILTLYYNPRTFDQIFPWHHGAGDFVIKVDGEHPEVRLVTVRQYGPLADPEDMSMEEALLFFFLNLSIRMRLDRMDGIGEIAWAGKDCLRATWEGFLEGLWIKEKEGTLAPGFRKDFLKELRRFSVETLTERFSELLASYAPEAPDLPIIRKNIIPHINQVHKIILS
jgi:hypothetical protein